ncbi:MAG: hypothetical protein A2131_02355 [Candidatus Sungbacteria bacterium GWC2_49_10]|uniref:Thioredoxin domain-containing protein n=1 Tax=Candidatus Sungbacteria bacterium GWC2_49_10 TaxID=1802263 RepID=A0A1G2K288_9BACT|nr:MAG: hypothetical protein A2131_02355 [Candidatus Sungbacteria bacterium GWC2_49_10]
MEDMNIMPEAPVENHEKSENTYLIPAAIIVAGLIVAGAVMYAFSPNKGAESGNTAKSGLSDTDGSFVSQNLADDDPVLGNASAPVTLVEFGDFQCPFCKKFHDEARKEILDTYVETGKVKIVYRDFPLENIHLSARPAAEAAECADDQGKFWPYHDALYTRQAELAKGTMNYAALARELGMDKTAFEKCVKDRKYENEVTKDYEDGVKAGVDGTPALFINGVKVTPAGAQPFSVFQTAIEAALR